MCYQNFRVARKILKRSKNKLFGVIGRFQILQYEKQKKSLEGMTNYFYDLSRDGKYGLFKTFFLHLPVEELWDIRGNQQVTPKETIS